MSFVRRYFPLITLLVAIASLYFYGLSRVGVLDPDEPRYLAIGHAMAASGDFVTPRLWGSPWFEKPPLLYWMTAVGASMHLGPELAGRFPVALLSLAFLGVMFLLLRRQFGVPAAAVSAVLLATSLGWLAYSNLALTDLPLAVCFSLAVFVALPLVEPNTGSSRADLPRWIVIGFALGLATLAKGLVPVALAVPFLWFLRHRWRSWFIALASASVVALPWYVLMYLRNGRAFLFDFFWKHHVERLYSASLQHVQPWWYYLPVLLAALYPWTPLFARLFFPQSWNRKRRFLASCVLFGLLLFSVSLNKLPGYLLPLLPLVFALLGSAIAPLLTAGHLRAWLMPCAVLIATLPLIAVLLPQTLQAGRIILPAFPHIGLTALFYIAAPMAAVLFSRRAWAGIVLVLCLVAGCFYIKITAFPILEASVSARSVWQRIRNDPGRICTDWIDRNWAYGIAFYRGAPYPVCVPYQYDFALRSNGRSQPVLVPLPKKP